MATTLAFCLVAVVYVATRAVNHTEAEDALNYLTTISQSPFRDQFHPNHLLYNAVGFALFRGLQALGYPGSAELPVQLLNIVAGVAALLLTFRLSQRLRVGRRYGLLLTLGVAFSYGFWWYSVEVESYVIPIVFILLSLQQFMVNCGLVGLAGRPRPPRALCRAGDSVPPTACLARAGAGGRLRFFGVEGQVRATKGMAARASVVSHRAGRHRRHRLSDGGRDAPRSANDP
jgi:hypothetical protein